MCGTVMGPRSKKRDHTVPCKTSLTSKISTNLPAAWQISRLSSYALLTPSMDHRSACTPSDKYQQSFTGMHGSLILSQKLYIQSYSWEQLVEVS